MTHNELPYFVALSSTGHFGRVTEPLHHSQPTLSAAIKKFENELSVLLFERACAKTLNLAIRACQVQTP